MNIYFKEKLKAGIGIIVVALVLLLILWLLIFVTDFVMYKLNRPMLFSITSVIEKDDVKITTEKGLGYYYETDSMTYNNFYLFGKKIK